MIDLKTEDLEIIFDLLWEEQKNPKHYSDKNKINQCKKTAEKIAKISNMRFEQRSGDVLIPVTREEWEEY